MPSITVQTMRQRYARVPVMEPDPDNPGQERQKVITVDRKRRRGDRPVTKKVFTNDKTRPLDPQKCERCREPIMPGQKYRCISIKQTFGGVTRIRCINCPSWLPWEYTDALWARVAQIQNEEVDGSDWEGEEEAKERAGEIAEMIRELAAEKQEALDNMPDGLRDASEHADVPDQLEDWAGEVESAVDNAEDFPEGKCSNCGGEQPECSVHVEEKHSDDPDAENYCDGTEECLECNGSGEGDEVDQDELSDWRESAALAIRDALDSSPV